MIAYSPIVEKAEAEIREIFRTKLPDWCRYHTLEHTIEVVRNSAAIAAAYELPEWQVDALIVAAWFHDAGYVMSPYDHETHSNALAIEFLTATGVQEEFIRTVSQCIEATRVPQRPATLLEEIICDADLQYLGTDELWKGSELLREEWSAARGQHYTDDEWLRLNRDFIRSHVFHTEFARARFGPKRAENLDRLESATMPA